MFTRNEFSQKYGRYHKKLLKTFSGNRGLIKFCETKKKCETVRSFDIYVPMKFHTTQKRRNFASLPRNSNSQSSAK